VAKDFGKPFKIMNSEDFYNVNEKWHIDAH
jgi:hypothetical protein